jgi:hypothetical protein
MPYIGNTVQTQGFTPAIDYFNGNGVTVTFTLTRPVASVAQMIVAIDNVIQNPSTAFTVSGSSITFTSAPLSGTNNIWVEYTSLITTYAAISQDPTVIGDITTNGGGFLSTGDFGNSYIAGAILDYVTGTGRVTVGPSEAVTLYNGGSSGRNALLTANSTGVGIGTTSPGYKLDVNSTSGMRVSVATGGYNWINLNSGYTGNLSVGLNDNGGSGAFRIAQYNSSGAFVRSALDIDSSGRVTIPNNPAFRATRTAGAVTGLSTIVFNRVDYNRGSNYNNSTGVFTAPVTGAYFFAYCIETNGSGANFLIQPRKNGSAVNTTEFQANSSGTTGIGYSIVVDMAANDTFDLLLSAGYTIYGGGNYTFMSGYLIG